MRYFIMLLSTDWFWPFWAEIGLNVDPATKEKIRTGCREIVRKVIAQTSVHHEGDFEHINWSDPSESEARSRFEQLLESLNEKDLVSEVVEAWTVRNYEDSMGSTMILRLLTHELIGEVGAERIPVPSRGIRAIVGDSLVNYNIDPPQFEDISMSSMTTWDNYIRSLFEAIPTEVPPKALATYLQPNVRIYRAKMLWKRVRARLSAKEQQELLSWYRAMARTRMPLDPIPSFIRERADGD